MRVFVTGATGFIGSALVVDLMAAGHSVIGLTRSEAGAAALAEVGAEAHQGDLSDLESLKAGAAKADAVAHLAFNHDFSTYMANCEDDRRVIEAIGSVLKGSDRPFVITSGTGMGRANPGQVTTERDPPAPSSVIPRAASEEALEALVAQGVNGSTVRLPQVHDTKKQGLISPMIASALEKGAVAYLGEGKNRFAAAPRLDVARLYRLALERGEPGARYHAVSEEGVAMVDIAQALGRRLGLPVRSITAEEAPAHFGWLAMFIGMDAPASSALTREWLNWTPTGRGLVADLEELELSPSP